MSILHRQQQRLSSSTTFYHLDQRGGQRTNILSNSIQFKELHLSLGGYSRHVEELCINTSKNEIRVKEDIRWYKVKLCHCEFSSRPSEVVKRMEKICFSQKWGFSLKKTSCFFYINPSLGPKVDWRWVYTIHSWTFTLLEIILQNLSRMFSAAAAKQTRWYEMCYLLQLQDAFYTFTKIAFKWMSLPPPEI